MYKRSIALIFLTSFLLIDTVYGQIRQENQRPTIQRQTIQRPAIQRPAIGLHFFYDHFTTTDSLSSSGRTDRFSPGLAVSYQKGLSTRLDLETALAASFPKLPGKNDGGRFLFLEASASLLAKLIPGRHAVVPFLLGGAGVSTYNGDWHIFFPAGIGAQANLPGETFLLFHAQYRFPVTGAFTDGNTKVNTGGQVGHFYYSAGIAGVIGRKKNNAGPLKMRPLVPQENPGPAPAPDTDGDGIVDSLDACPLVPGLVLYRGCPPPEARPDTPVAKEKNTVKVIDTTANRPVQREWKKKLDLAARNVFFRTDSYVLLPVSYKALDEVGLLLKQNPVLKLIVEGHTDNTGEARKNQLLSERRAKTALEYLVRVAGVERLRLSAIGYGSSKPVAENTTAAGRSRNRRVEFVIF